MSDVPVVVEARLTAARTRTIGTWALGGVTVFAVVAAAMQFLRTDLDWVRATLSFYLLGPVGLWLQLAYLGLAMSLGLIGAGYYGAATRTGRSPAALVLFLVGAIALAITAWAETDRGGPGAMTTHAYVHAISAPLAFLGTTVGMLVQSWSLRRDPRWRRHFALAFALAVFCFISLWLHALWRDLPRGLSQKAVIAAILVWLALAARWLRQTSPSGHV
ncbi:DUF998 domain-containing protein [Lysobacter sp. MMG2]|uniref:DUF998 domain-containing protein n=1 Tax=Lysobacter sp. MMG2 TaxID=2801338 RepID=UPI001C230FA6|nr:DUF998 domain-containing protein [Lysobacter sp. MMG2]MBU8977877.1 DUF998 domain-containing protein [Lysobacter sp. MMG2]